MGYTNKDAYAKTFPDRYQVLGLKGASEKDISAYVAMYHKNKLVNQILEQAVIPSWLLNQDAYQKAINKQLDLMANALSEKVQTDAANSLLTHLKPPETKKVELDISVRNEGGIADLKATMEQLAQTQLELIKGGQNAREVGRTPLLIEGEVAEVKTVAQWMPPAREVDTQKAFQEQYMNQPVRPQAQAFCAHGVQLGMPCEVCNAPPAAKSKAKPSLFGTPAPEPEEEPEHPFAGLEDLPQGGDFEYREDVVEPRNQTVGLSLFA
jgi:hypothetical protein